MAKAQATAKGFRNLLNLFADKMLNSSSQKAIGEFEALVVGNFRMINLDQMPKHVRLDLYKLLTKLSDPQGAAELMRGLRSAKVADRVEATRRIQMLAVDMVIKGKRGIDVEVLQKLIDIHGVNALLIVPGFTEAYRRHLAAGGTAESFAKFLATDRSKRRLRILSAIIDDARMLEVFGIRMRRTFSVAAHSPFSPLKDQEAVLASLEAARKILDDKEFVRFLLSKCRATIEGREDAIEKAIMQVMSNGRLPALQAEDLVKIFETAHRSQLQGPLGELLALPRLIERAKKLASKKGATGKIYILLDVRADTVRTMVARKERSTFVKQIADIDAPDEKSIAALEQSAATSTQIYKNQEFTDGLIVTFDGKGSVNVIGKQEVKVDENGLINSLRQVDKTSEDLEAIHRLTARIVIEVSASGSARKLSIEDARAVANITSGGKTPDLLEFTEDTNILKQISDIENSGANVSAAVQASAALREKRKIKGLAQPNKEIVVGSTQIAELRASSSSAVRSDNGITLLEGIPVVSYGHEYETLVDVVVHLLASVPFKPL